MIESLVVVAGDRWAGKTVLLFTFTRQEVLEGYIPTVFENYHLNRNVLGQKCTFHLRDTSGLEDERKLRILPDGRADLFMLCFSINSRAQLVNAEDAWIREIRQNTIDTPVLLVGTNAHFRNNPEMADKLVPREDGEAAAQRIGAVGYVECSPNDVESVNRAFERAFEECVKFQQPSQTKPSKPKLFSLKKK